ncbi:MAG: leucyl/phenylalanyl-tRNA--protein transferase [Flavobacteriaceae bacterium]|nr:leucyl/phenylalanyl-tRNA--protein transferase [Flavobacteriaceae bacterium]
MIYLSKELWFPDVSEAGQDGLLAVGGDLSTERLLLAYRSGIFPWSNDGDPILWWSPQQRMVLFPDKLKVSKSLCRLINQQRFNVTENEAFSEVIQNCALMKRDGQAGTWITDEMLVAYQNLNKLGHAHSIEVWEHEKLVGGLYGIDLPEQKVFCGESMYSKVSNASKVALYYLTENLKSKGYLMIDCQVYNPHLESLGAEEISRKQFLEYLE